MIKLVIVLIILQSVLGQITATPAPTTYRYFVFTEECYQTLIIEKDLFHFECLKKSLVKMLGYGVVVGAAIVKVPQIYRIIQDGSTVGISFGSVMFESFTNLCAVAYHINKENPFSVFGETLLIAIQMVVIHLLFIIYSPPSSNSKTTYILSLLPVLVIFWAAFNPTYFPNYVLENTLVIQMILLAGARILQIIEIHRLKSTGSLALTTCALMFLGNTARVATAIVQVAHDWLFGLSVLQAFLLNGYILCTFVIFGSKQKETTPKEKKEKVK